MLLFVSLSRPWIDQRIAFRRYWNLYGGIVALARSPYPQISLVLTVVCYPFTSEYGPKAAELAVSALPNLLGFSVGAMAIVLALSSAPLFRTLAQRGRNRSYFMVLTNALVHFIFVQVIALTVAIVARLTDWAVLEPVVMFFLFYAILVVVPAGLHLYATAQIYNASASVPKAKEKGPLGYPRPKKGR